MSQGSNACHDDIEPNDCGDCNKAGGRNLADERRQRCCIPLLQPGLWTPCLPQIRWDSGAGARFVDREWPSEEQSVRSTWHLALQQTPCPNRFETWRALNAADRGETPDPLSTSAPRAYATCG